MNKKKYFAILCLLLISSSVIAQSTRELTDSLSILLRRAYVFPEKADTMGSLIRKKQKEGKYEQFGKPGDLAATLTSDLRSVYADRHLSVRYDPQLEKRISIFSQTRKQDTNSIRREQRQNFFFRKTEILPGNIGYIDFSNFPDTNALSRQTVRAAFTFVAHTDALIIDLRGNFGGSTAMASEILSYFFPSKTYLGRHYNRIENSWKNEWIVNEPSVTGGLSLSMPVYFLTSRRTFSAAEGFAYTLQQLKKARIIGQPTAGGAHATRSFALGQGYVAFIPFTRSENAVSSTDWEGNGAIPDDTTSDSEALISAKKIIYSQFFHTATDSTEIRKFNWLLNDLRTAFPVLEKDLALYCGSFEEFTFFKKEGQLYGTADPKGQSNSLTYVGNNLFRGSQWQVEFIKDESGNFSMIKLYWPDGWVDTIKRSANPERSSDK
ncbi:MAG: S41 family peptidase [Sphingobacteriaceae bacterium]|nr:S41 family peptidase [Sphingobacteriaceae bacterium]